MKTVVVGAGPAGLMAAGSIKNGTVLVLEQNEKPGKKLYITGKGRCNITNDCELEQLLKNVVTNQRFLYSAFSRFLPSDTIVFFEAHGVPLKTERGGRVFPASDKASDITAALKKAAQENGAQIRLTATVQSVWKDHKQQKFKISLVNGEELTADNLILATGGASYPLTGSKGDGYRFARQLGHTVIPPRAALVPILVTESVKSLEGLSLKNVSVSANINRKKYCEFGEMLFTADGMSGPCILSLSSFLSGAGVSEGTALAIDLKPALSKAQLDTRILRDFDSCKNKQLKNALFDLLPKSLIPYIIQAGGFSGEEAINSVTKEQRARLVDTFKNLTFYIKALEVLEKGIVTGGGVDVKEINPKTMESKLVKNLYFAGELIDVDALTGGFNIQIAISTGYLAGSSAGEKL